MQSHRKSARMDAGVHMPISGSSLTSSWPSHSALERSVSSFEDRSLDYTNSEFQVTWNCVTPCVNSMLPAEI